MAVNLSTVKRCPSCGGENIIFNKKDSEIFCKDCRGVFSELSAEAEEDFEKASDVI